MKLAAYRYPNAAFLSELRRRRLALFDLLEGSACLLQGVSQPSSAIYPRVAFKQESNFHYLTGLFEAGGVAVFAPAAAQKSALFLPDWDANGELWHGPMTNPEKAAELFGFEASYPMSELPNKLPELLKGARSLYGNHSPYGSPSPEIDSHAEVKAGLEKSKLKSKGTEWRDASVLLGELRVKKSPWEIEQLRRAGKLGSAMHELAMQRCKPGMFEYQLQSAMEGFVREQASHFMGYPSIVAAGENACCLHYNVNTSQIEDGDLVLIDAGCEWNEFTSDITRTFPANGKFNTEQRKIYSLVLKAQNQAIAMIRPGATLKQLNDHAILVLTEGLLEFGLLSGKLETAISDQLYREFYPHSLSHWLGMDVHDVGSYELAGSQRPLEPGMCLTVEPGIYVQKNAAVANCWKGIGIRIEDDILVTESGFENLVTCVKGVDEVEQLCAIR